MKNNVTKPIWVKIGWAIVALVTIIWLIIQQVQINEYKAELAALENEMAEGQELYSEYATAEKMWENKEYRERKARENDFIYPDEVVVEINEG